MKQALLALILLFVAPVAHAQYLLRTSPTYSGTTQKLVLYISQWDQYNVTLSASTPIQFSVPVISGAIFFRLNVCENAIGGFTPTFTATSTGGSAPAIVLNFSAVASTTANTCSIEWWTYRQNENKLILEESTPTSASIDGICVNGVCPVTKFGAKGDGVTDDTTAIQAAINAAIPGGTVLFPARPCGSPYVISLPLTTVANTTGQSITFQGQGANTTTNAIFGNSGWTTLSNHCGSVIYQVTAGTDGLDLGTAATVAAPYRVQDLMILGAGSGTSNGIALGKFNSVGAPYSYFSNVLIANFQRGLTLNNTEDSAFINVETRGNTTGLFLPSGTASSNQNNFYNFKSNTNATCVDVETAADTFNIWGGLCQNAYVNGMVINGLSNSTISGVHFENTNTEGSLPGLQGTGYGLEIMGNSQFNTISGNRFGELGAIADIFVTGAVAIDNVFMNNNAASFGILEDASAAFNYFVANKAVAFNDFSTRGSTSFDPYGLQGGGWTFGNFDGLGYAEVAGMNLHFMGGVITQGQLANPTGLTVTKPTGGVAGSTTWCYQVACSDSAGTGLPVAQVCDTTGNASLVTTNEIVKWTPSPGADGCNVYGNTSGGELLMSTCPGGVGCSTTSVSTFTDAGIIAPSGALPTLNTTGGFVTSPKGITYSGFTFANIASYLTTNGQSGYCSDCTIANPCAGSGTGAIAKRLAGVNVCN